MYLNFVKIYDRVYDLIEKDGYAMKMSVPSFYDKSGNAVDAKDDNSYRKLVNLKLTRPDLIFVADECDTNTNMSKDKVSAGNKIIHQKGISVSMPGCTSDTHVTTMGITALTGDSVYCVVIIQKTTPFNFIERYGFDINAQW